MNKLAEITLVIGGVLLVISSIITFKTNLPQETENIIYFRGILLGSGLVLFSSAAITKNLIRSILLSLGSGNVALLIISTINLIDDDRIDLDLYFDITMLVVGITFVVLISVRLWLNKILTLLGF